MTEVYKGKIEKCSHCGAFVTYSESDIVMKEKGYGVMTYAGETYMAKTITCPKCGKEIEVY